MKSIARAFAAAILVLTPLPGFAARVKEMPLQPVSAGTGKLFPESSQTVRVVVKDERPDKAILASGFFGAKAEQGKGHFYAYVPENPEALTRLFETAAKEAVTILGMKEGDGNVLEITIRDFRIDFYILSGFGAYNCIGYGHIAASLLSADGRELQKKEFRLAGFDHTHAATSVKEVGRESISRIYLRAAWEAAARTLLAQYPAEPDPREVERLLAAMDANKDDIARTFWILWLGLTGKGNPAAAEKLLSVYRREENQRVAQSAAVAIGMLGIADARAEIEAVLTGSKKLPEWDPSDVEEAWHLLHSLALFGATDLGSKIPATKNMRTKLVQLVQFHETGQIPPLSPKESEELAEAKKKLKK